MAKKGLTELQRESYPGGGRLEGMMGCLPAPIVALRHGPQI